MGKEQSGEADWRHEKICSGGGRIRAPGYSFARGWLLGCRLPRTTSDHFPILLKGGGFRKGPSPFRFENMWLKVDGFKELLRGWWQEAGGRGRASFRLATKLKVLKDKIKAWNRDVFGRLNHVEAEGLEQPFIEEEIHAALMGMNGDKAPDPDGFIVAFWQSCWDFVKEEIVDLFKEPISLLGGLYKFLAKVLTNRLKEVLDKVVSADQNAFVKGRQILDASLIANEVMHKMGFGVRWMEWIWGLRQGDPLSPYLFVLGMEVLSALLRRTVDGGFISGYHLTYLSWILAWFEAASGLKINLAKSEVIPVGEVEDIDELAVEIGCKVGALPFVYLGLPLGANHKTTAMWDEVESSKWERGPRLTSELTSGAAMRRCPKLFPKCLLWRPKGMPWRAVSYAEDLRISPEEDSVIWKGGGHDLFRIRDVYKLLTGPNVITFPKKSIWVDKVPTKVAFFAWEATWEKVERGWDKVEEEICSTLGLDAGEEILTVDGTDSVC
ncbi:hypothetical protein CK203_078389 [Vitis vinifera]|uniref:Reverse transcriptase zinc-binding domain-containing protein n=1 Tax=Vitis vinifera TaxID=29760 RepID=A0A438DXU1_VITVI|nr:hypothetical protein CK203_078389 [Vitis vinifera]